MQQGIVIGYRRAGYGWLDWNGTRVWIHVQDTRDKQGHLLPALKVGWTIQFDVTEAPKGPRARNAVVVDTTATEETICNQIT
jgi:cold shock CspA family protein